MNTVVSVNNSNYQKGDLFCNCDACHEQVEISKALLIIDNESDKKYVVHDWFRCFYKLVNWSL